MNGHLVVGGSERTSCSGGKMNGHLVVGGR